ncbi:MAG TPA: NnrU family protein [Usitatibacteraceae bacterium]|nr:NnrU family protein [Usitatibacteraceae bacterium]
MLLLIAGLIVFLGVHSVRIVADPLRARFIAERGELLWKTVYALLSILGFAMIVYGYGAARAAPAVLWVPPAWTRHLAALLTLPAIILVVAAYVPGNALQARLKHPMLIGTQIWAAGHLLANGNLADLLLFGGFLLWAALCHRAARQRDFDSGRIYVSKGAVRTTIAVVAGTGVWLVFAFYLHAKWIGVRPFG